MIKLKREKRAHIIDLEEGEEVVKTVRKHLFVFYMRFLGLLVADLLPLLFSSYLISFINSKVADGQGSAIFWSIYLLYFFVIWTVMFYEWTDYYLDVWIITNERIINIEQQGLFSRIISEQRLFRIQDVTSEVTGVLPTIFKYGNVYVQTAAEKERFSFEQIPDPNGVRDIIIKLAEVDRERMAKEIIPA